MWRKQQIQKIILFSIIASFIIGLVSPAVTVRADPTPTLYSTWTAAKMAQSNEYYNAMTSCISKSSLSSVSNAIFDDTITEQDAKVGKWFYGSWNGQQYVSIGYFLGKTSNNGSVSCSDGTWVKDAFTLWGYSDMIQALCDSGAQRSNRSNCMPPGAGNFTGADLGGIQTNRLSVAKFQSTIKTNVYGGSDPNTLRDSQSDKERAAQYVQERSAFFAGCLGDPNMQPYLGSITGNRLYSIDFVDESGKLTTNKYYAGSGKTRTEIISYYVSNGMAQREQYPNMSSTCEKLETSINNNAKVFKKSIDANLAFGAGATVGGAVAGSSTASTSTCVIDGIGWILCPVIKTMAKIADGAFSILANNFLSTNSEMVKVGGGAYEAWSNMRNIANIAFVIFFMIIIFSQLTGVGIDNYGIKKLLPKIIIAAILVNISFYICQIAVDLSNIVGWGLKDLMAGFTPTVSMEWSNGLGGSSFETLAGGLLGAGAAALIGVALWASIGTLIPVLIAAVVALMMIVFILIARQALVILLIVISPLAFVAFLLPNTEQWFKKWLDAFKAVLLVFPIVALVYGASTLASGILQSVAGGNQLLQIAYSAVMVLPLFVVPGLLKKSLDGVGNIGAKVNEWGAKRGASLGKKGSEAYENTALGRGRALRQASMKDYKDQKFATALGKNGIRRKLARGLGVTAGGKYANQALDRTAIASKGAIEDKEVANAELLMRNGVDPGKMIDHAQAQLSSALTSGDAVKARAAQKILLSSGSKGRKGLREAISSHVPSGDAAALAKQNTAISAIKGDLAKSGLKGSDVVLDKYAFDNGGNTISDITNAVDTYSGLSSTEIAGQSADLLRAGIENGGISKGTAAGIASDPRLSVGMGAEERGVLEEYATRPSGETRANP